MSNIQFGIFFDKILAIHIDCFTIDIIFAFSLFQIKRADLSDLSRQEFVIQGLASHMTIDSINARLYWVTENSVESCLLNGEDHIKHFFIPYFSGSRVISLTLNFDLGKLLWYMKRYDRQELYMMDLIQGEETGGSNQYQLIGTVNNITK